MIRKEIGLKQDFLVFYGANAIKENKTSYSDIDIFKLIVDTIEKLSTP